MARLAVVIPSYNHAKYIAAAVDSAVQQSLPPAKVVIVDDGSTDNSLDVLRALAQKSERIELIEQTNAGAHNALNRGIAAAGEVDYVAILNSDDLYEPERLERCIAYLEQNPKMQVVCTSLQMIDPDGALLPESHAKARRLAAMWENPDRDTAEWLGISNFAKTTSNFVGRAHYFRQHPFRDYRYVHDYFFAVVSTVEGVYGVLPERLLRYRTHATNTIKQDGIAPVAREVVRMNFDLMRELAPLLEKSAEARGAFTRYFRAVLGNHSDFRAEVFLAETAQVIGSVPPLDIDQRLATLTSEVYPELAAAPSQTFRREVERAKIQRLQMQLARSRWLGLGNFFGLAPDVFSTSGEIPLATIHKRLEESAWVRLGQRLGAFSFPS
jgi:glycosyltransferase involved in cell wall biosynthesis